MKNPRLDLSKEDREYIATLFKKYGMTFIPHTGPKGVLHLRAKRNNLVRHVTSKHIFLAMSQEKQEELLKKVRISFDGEEST